MFKLAPNTGYVCTWPVTVQKPAANGKTESAKIDFEFELLSEEELTQAIKGGDSGLVCRAVKGWKRGDLADHQGNELEFNEDNLKLLSKIAYMRTPIVAEYMRFYAGVATKN